MTSGIDPISLPALSLGFIPVFLVILILHRWANRAGEALYGVARMVLQLSLIGYVLVYIFAADKPWIVLVVLSLMILVSSWIALRTTGGRQASLYPLALASVFLGGSGVLALVTQGVLKATPWYAPSTLVPLAGMIFAAAMNSISLAAERLFAEMDRGETYERARATAFRASLIPITNSLFAVGLVSLPGMMTGQILSGVSPLVAARYQIMVMCMMFASAGLASALFLFLVRNRVTQEPHGEKI